MTTTLDYVVANATGSHIDAVFYDGKRVVGRSKLLKGALTVEFNGMIFERAQRRDVMGRKQSTMRRGAVKFTRLDKANEHKELELRRRYENDRRIGKNTF